MRTPFSFRLLGPAALAMAVSSCQPATHPTRFSETLYDHMCRFAYDCCQPVERAQLGFLGGTSFNVDTCREQFRESFGGAFNVAAAAVDKGTATFDAEAADRCTKTNLEAMNSCDSQALFGNPNLTLQSFYLANDGDEECLALARRGFTRGTVDDGGDCTADVDCADFGACIFEGEGQTRAAVGTCQAFANVGDDCAERGCVPNLSCQVNDAGDGLSCQPVERLADGEDCSAGGICGSTSSCEPRVGVCSDESGPCTDAFDCVDLEAVCTGGGEVCTAAETRDIELCTGT